MSDVKSKLVERQIHQWDRINAVLCRKHGKGKGEGGVACPVITISREIGAGGRTIAKALSENLHMDIFGISIIDAIAEDAMLERRVVDTLDEAMQSSIENRILGLLTGRVIDKKEYSVRLARAITIIAEHGRAIFLGRGACRVLGEHASLRVRFYAPVEFRIRRVMEYDNVPEEEAKKKVHEVDEQRRSFIRNVFNADVNNVRDYDLCLDTSRVPLLACEEIIITALKSRCSPACWDSLIHFHAHDESHF
ncbi:MAG: cytidylate kinase-like family protein [Candidatus Sumerlaeota bacterium]|nr:cytidylate kinase-like family protein [Candidatus Sumerlaeota bacterium]